MKSIATKEMADFLRAAIKMLGGELLDENNILRLVENGKEFIKPLPGGKLRELTALEAECVALEFSLGFESARVLAEVAVFHGGKADVSEYGLIRFAVALNPATGSILATILGDEERKAREAGIMPPEATGAVLEIDNDALCIYAGVATDKLNTKIANMQANMVVKNFDLENWKPSSTVGN